MSRWYILDNYAVVERAPDGSMTLHRIDGKVEPFTDEWQLATNSKTVTAQRAHEFLKSFGRYRPPLLDRSAQ